MDALRQRPVFGLDLEARKQLRETRATLLEHLRDSPDDLKALVLADVIGELDPDREPALAAHRRRFRETRPADWQALARELGLDRVLFHLAHGMRTARIGRDAVPVIERRAIEISEARRSGVANGLIEASCVPDALRALATYHASGHLAHVRVHRGELRQGELVLEAQPGAGHFTIVEKRGGYGTMVREHYRGGSVVTILNTPWHDGEESIEPAPWTKWVMQNLDELARLARP